MAVWQRVNGVVYGVIGLHLFIYFATVSCVVRSQVYLCKDRDLRWLVLPGAEGTRPPHNEDAAHVCRGHVW